MTDLPNPTPTWRDLFLRLTPRWLKQFNGIRLMYAIGLHFDLLGEALDQGIRARYPGQNDDALRFIGRQRGIVRGPAEPVANYATRLRYWRNSRRRKSTYFALLEQLQGVLAPFGFQTAIVSDAGFKYTLAPSGHIFAQYLYDPLVTPSGTVVVEDLSADWNWGGTQNPSRFWVLIQGAGLQWPGGYAYGNDLTWDDAGLVEDSGTWGSTALPVDVSTIRAIIQDWAPPHSAPQQLILMFLQADFDTFPSAGNKPDGVWNYPGNRNPDFEYWNLTE